MGVYLNPSSPKLLWNKGIFSFKLMAKNARCLKCAWQQRCYRQDELHCTAPWSAHAEQALIRFYTWLHHWIQEDYTVVYAPFTALQMRDIQSSSCVPNNAVCLGPSSPPSVSLLHVSTVNSTRLAVYSKHIIGEVQPKCLLMGSDIGWVWKAWHSKQALRVFSFTGWGAL